MLLKFSVQNFRSFKDAVTLDLVSSSKIQSLPEHVSRFGHLKVLKNAAIYGANAAGKSNLHAALSLVQFTLVQGRLPLNVTSSYCKLRPLGSTEESSFDLLFEVDDKFFDYGFSARLAERTITSEWLIALELGTERSWKTTTLFERREAASPKLGTSVAASDTDKSRFELYASDFASSRDGLFLSELNRGKQFEASSSFHLFQVAYRYLCSRVRIVGTGDVVPYDISFLSREKLRNISSIMAGFDTGIDKVERVSIEASKLGELIPKQVLDDVKGRLSDIAGRKVEAEGMVVRTGTSFVVVEYRKNEDPDVSKICTKHAGSFYDFDFGEESEGTKRLFDFLGLLFTGDRDAVFFVDEIDRSLHPMLTKHLIELVNATHAHDNVQLIFTTHEDSLMDGNVLRNDEIWFIDRSAEDGSHLYPLDQFKVRSDKKVSKAYWDGRYGGVPVLSSVRSLVEDECSEEGAYATA